MQIRTMVERDLEAIFAIYDHEVRTGTATFDTEPSTAQSRAQWRARHREERYPVVVADADGVVIGWASLSPYSDRCAYARTAEVSVYVHPAHQGRGVGRALMDAVLDQARSLGLGTVLSRVCTEGVVSLRLHSALGFRSVGTLRRVGEKFGRVLDVELFQLHLDGA